MYAPDRKVSGILPLLDIQQSQDEPDPFLHLRLRHVIEVAVELQVLPDREPLVQRAFLENDPDVLADLGFPQGHVVPVDPQGPRCLFLDGAKGVDGRALPRPIGPQEGEDAAFLHGKGNVVHGRKVAVFFGEAFDFDALGCHAAFSSGGIRSLMLQQQIVQQRDDHADDRFSRDHP
jgi:hypothetical protein